MQEAGQARIHAVEWAPESQRGPQGADWRYQLSQEGGVGQNQWHQGAEQKEY
jgi:hypothetical protein